jgi:hypothetical protein
VEVRGAHPEVTTTTAARWLLPRGEAYD